MKLTVLAAVAASATAFAPAMTNVRMPMSLNFEFGEYDDKMWDNDAKKDVYDKWDPNSPRSTRNFNPFETFKGNSPDASGIYPGEVSGHIVCCDRVDSTIKLHHMIFFYDELILGIAITFVQARYKDPQRGDVSYAIMQAEMKEAEERKANPKAGEEKGCPGCKN